MAKNGSGGRTATHMASKTDAAPIFTGDQTYTLTRLAAEFKYAHLLRAQWTPGGHQSIKVYKSGEHIDDVVEVHCVEGWAVRLGTDGYFYVDYGDFEIVQIKADA